jgi:hypothetical protein
MDIVRKVPEDRIDDCITELSLLIKKTSLMWAETKKVCEDNGIEFTENLVKLPDAIDWIDDGLGKITAKIKIAEDESGSIVVEAKL